MSERGPEHWSRSLIFRLPLGLLLVITGYQIGYAASQSLASTTLGAGSAAVASCDSDGFSFSFASNGQGQVTTVNVSGIAGSCAGGNLLVTLIAGSANVGAGTASLPASGFAGTATVGISGAPVASSVTVVRAAIEGP